MVANSSSCPVFRLNASSFCALPISIYGIFSILSFLQQVRNANRVFSFLWPPPGALESGQLSGCRKKRTHLCSFHKSLCANFATMFKMCGMRCLMESSSASNYSTFTRLNDKLYRFLNLSIQPFGNDSASLSSSDKCLFVSCITVWATCAPTLQRSTRRGCFWFMIHFYSALSSCEETPVRLRLSVERRCLHGCSIS